MSKFKVGDHERWNSEAGHVTGHITKVHISDTTYKGHTRHCSKDDPQYESRATRPITWPCTRALHWNM